ncbi:MAG: RluA family pseudouridine synthase [Cyclobacteriaceae bacterium]
MRISLEIIHEDNHLLVINKPAGVLVQGDSTGDVTLADICKDYVRRKYNKPGNVFMGVVHRLDRPVSGVIVFAKTSKALTRLNKLFQERQVKKTYWAIVKNRPPETEEVLVHWLIKDKTRNVTSAYTRKKPGSLESTLTYRVVNSVQRKHLLSVEPETGRPHQIRVQLAKVGCPIIGDLRYGNPPPNDDASICLHARNLEFEHPVLKTMVRYTAPVPDMVLWNEFKKIRDA